ncbi:type II toxin-antitoxin system MqsA family antitoxin [Candidatus Competibacter phosphatis]|nr:type II toxin-antitoxin system MqsA family antitoxin [Candidatus Competibacter phosphatis]
MVYRFHDEVEAMKCVICKTGETHPGTASMVLEREGTTVLIRDVPGEICDTCGEVYYDAETTERLLDQAEQAYRNGVDVEVKRYKKAA